MAKYGVIIIDGAAGLPMSARGGKTSLELAHTPNLDAMVRESSLGLVQTVPSGMEPSSACACMSIMGYDPQVYYKGRAAIEAVSMGIPVGECDVVFRCNLVAVKDGRMWDYSAGHISTAEAKHLVACLNERLGGKGVTFYPGVGYRHILKLIGREETLKATCTPPHDIPDKPIEKFLPKGPGSGYLLELMERSKDILRDNPVNVQRRSKGEVPATMIWLFWGSGKAPEMPSFKKVYGLNSAMTSGVDLLRGLARMAGMDVLEIKGVTDGQDNNYAGQAEGALKALENHDMVFVHIESPDEAGHGGFTAEKIEAIERIDKEVLSRFRSYQGQLRLLVMPDHPTPIEVRTHTADAVPFLLWGNGFKTNGAKKFTEKEAKGTSFFVKDGYNIMNCLLGRGKEKF